MSARKAEWENDQAFCNVAMVCWAEDWERATSSPAETYGPNLSRKQTSRGRMKLRHDGWKVMNLLESQVARCKTAVDTMVQRIENLTGSKQDANQNDS